MRFYSDSRARFKYAIDTQQQGTARSLFYNGGEGGIRPLDTRLTYTPLAGERLQPLGHFSVLRHSYPSTRAFGRSRGARYSTLRVSPFGSPP